MKRFFRAALAAASMLVPVAAIAQTVAPVPTIAGIRGYTIPAATLAPALAGTTGSTLAAGNDSRITGAVQKSNNLSDLASPSVARTNLGLGTAAAQAVGAFDTAGAAATAQTAAQAASVPTSAIGTTVAPLSGGFVPVANLPIGTAAGTVAAGNDSRITGAVQKTNNLSDLSSQSVARTNLGLGTAATLAAGAFDAAGTASSAITAAIGTTVAPLSGGVVPVANLPVGTGSTNVAAGNDIRITGAVQGSQVGVAGGTGIAVTAPVPRFIASGVNPREDLRGSIAQVENGGQVLVCLVGDSTGIGTPVGQVAGTPASVNSWEGVSPLLMRRLYDQNPGVNFKFENFSIPGTTYGNYLSNSAEASAQAYGITWVGAANWYQYVQSAGCNMVVPNWGVNDAYNMVPNTLALVADDSLTPGGTNKFKPDIIFVTSAIANPNAGGVQSLPTYIAGWIAGPSLVRAFLDTGASGFTSTYTNIWPHFGLIDVNRFFQQAVVGKDYEDQTSTDVTSQVPATFSVSSLAPLLLPQTDGDFQYSGSFVNQLSAMSSNVNVSIVVGEMDGTYDSLSSRFVLTPTTSGTVVQVQYLNSGSITLTKNYNVTGNNLAFTITKKNHLISFQLAGQTPWSQNFIVPTAPFQPEIFLGGGPTTAFTLTSTQYSIGSARPYNAILSNNQAYGPNVATLNASAAVAIAGTSVVTTTTPPASVVVGAQISDVPNPGAMTTGVVATGTSSSVTGNVLTVGGTVTNLFTQGQIATGVGVPANDIIQSQLTGTTGLAGTYQLSQTAANPTATETITGNGTVITAVNTGTDTITFYPAVTSPGISATDNIAIGSQYSTIGGNGINHDASWALNYIYGSVFNATDLCLICGTENGTAFASRQTTTSVAAATVTLPQFIRHLVEHPAGTLATLTVALPPWPRDGDNFDFTSDQAITALTVTAGAAPTSTTVGGAAQPLSYAAGSFHTWRYNLSLNEWIGG